ncbi:MAG: citrate/2-methylcitrate synthase [Candidatus Nanoarchaeia archaeon]
MIKPGLEGIEVAESSICYIDGKRGYLAYRGHPITNLAQKCDYETICYLLLFGKFPKKKEQNSFKQTLRKQQSLPPSIIKVMRCFPKKTNTMAVLRTAISTLSLYDKDMNALERNKLEKKAISTIAKLPLLIAAWHRIKQGKSVEPPNRKQSIAWNFLYLYTGKKPTQEEEKLFDTCLLLHAEHGFNASTFSSRVTVATLSDYYSGIVSAIGTLKGPLHGGANQKVLAMLKEIGLNATKTKVDAFVKKCLKTKRLIMGIGHRVYKVKDPRAKILESYIHELGWKDNRYKILKRIEELMEQEKGLYPNVDFFSGLVYSKLGIAPEDFPPVFAAARISGWSAHILEQLGDNRLIRPLSKYVGKKRLTL